MTILTARQGTNADLFPDVLALYANRGDRILDMTYGKGVFWRKVDMAQYRVTTNDFVTDADVHCDFRKTQFESESFNVVVLDPPYAKHGTSMKIGTADSYQLNHSIAPTSAKEVRALYQSGAKEALRLLVPNGILLIKCQDQIESGKQQWIHAELLKVEGFLCEDLFILVQNGLPIMRQQLQHHARKNHSYFIVLRKAKQ